MKVLDLFSGFGGFSLGLKWAGMETVAFCEIDPYARKILRKHWPDPIYEDIKELTGERIRKEIGTIDLVCAGPPCQPASCAGKQRGAADDRWLWPEALRIVREVHSRWVIFENPLGLLALDGGLAFESICAEMEKEGYEIQPFIIPAISVGAWHIRKRIWIIAHANGERELQPQRSEQKQRGRLSNGLQGIIPNIDRKHGDSSGHGASEILGQRPARAVLSGGEVVADSLCERLQVGQRKKIKPGAIRNKRNASPQSGRRDAELSLGVLAHGLSTKLAGIGSMWDKGPDIPMVSTGEKNRCANIRGLGNSVVPQIPQIIGAAIMEIENAHS